MEHTPGILIALLAPLAAAFAAGPDPLDIVRRSIDSQAGNSQRARSYTFVQRTDRRELGPNGEVRSQRSTTHDVTLLEGSSYRRLIERDGRPLPPEEEKREQELLRKSIEDRRHETDAQRARRLAEYNKRLVRNSAMLKEIPEAFDFRLRGEELIETRPVYVVDATPRPGYRPRDAEARLLFPKLKATLWIDKADFNWVRADAEVIDTVSYGWFLLRLSKGAHLRLEQVRVNGEVWLPRSVRMGGSARVGLFRKLSLEQELTFRDYRKFQSESELIPAQAAR
jgi:hypothetical protein